jgi:hypothetical protein
MTTINIALLIIGLVVSLIGLLEKVNKDRSRPWHRRLAPSGWALAALAVAGFWLGAYKETNSVDGRLNAAYPRFTVLLKDVTKYGHDDWARDFSYRMTLRLLLQKAHAAAFRNHTQAPRDVLANLSEHGDLPESMRDTLADLGKASVIDDALCKRLDFLRFHTYSTEWGRLADQRPSKATLESLRNDAEGSLDALAERAEDINPAGLRLNPSSLCGQDPQP